MMNAVPNDRRLRVILSSRSDILHVPIVDVEAGFVLNVDYEVPWGVDPATRLAIYEALDGIPGVRVEDGVRPLRLICGRELPPMSSIVTMLIALFFFLPMCSTLLMKTVVVVIGLCLSYYLRTDAITKMKTILRILKMLLKLLVRGNGVIAAVEILKKADVAVANASIAAGALPPMP